MYSFTSKTNTEGISGKASVNTDKTDILVENLIFSINKMLKDKLLAESNASNVVRSTRSILRRFRLISFPGEMAISKCVSFLSNFSLKLYFLFLL